ncbi:alpha/beta hydrolase [Streptomyces sp. NBRC 109706]|uniref:alpha/beta hydrolase n=1 Tax=Streptomyces sp. NBRC 109706 TaxID=1550035 RepID=UPI001F45F6DE|nr:alpha/beta hydrolase [Streptomyces sp. NBRC 109706]
MLLALVVVLVVLATAGWLASTRQDAPNPLAIQLSEWAHAEVAGRRPPSADAPPAEVAAFFADLGTARSERLAERFPLVVGNLSGAPVPLRYQANRRAIEDARAVELRRAEDARLSPEGQGDAARRAHRLASLLRADRQILAFDPTGPGRVAEVFGDLTTADRISLLVPGVDTDLITFERTEGRYTAPAGMAQALLAEERAQAPGIAAATIAWADYDAPPGLAMSAATAGRAERGAARLLDTLAGLPSDAELALFCHSYGSVVCGVAADELPSRVTDIAVTGSPGMRADSVADLGTSARVWAMRAADDWVADLPHLSIGPLGHGTDPVSPAFGARRLSDEGAHGHDGYYQPGAHSLRALALVGAGVNAATDCAPGGDGCAAFTTCPEPVHAGGQTS